MRPILELRNVHASYGKIEVLHGVSLRVPPGTVVALLGPNGAGKTTTLKVASGQLRPTSGHVHVAGKHVNGAPPDALVRAGVCSIPEGRGIFPNLTVEENLKLATFAGVKLQDVEAKTFDRFPRLQERRKQLAGTLSGGEQQMLAIARAIACEPLLLMLDEISIGLAPRIVAELFELVRQIASTGVSILLVEQLAVAALSVCDYAAIMVGGAIDRIGQPQDVEEALSQAYLGTRV
ncbi:MAG: ABC transporter ATP-binding protein [Actinomycetota bacterium]